jgi:uroporphyrinogen decarboxylase
LINMNHRERILTAIKHQPVDRLPTDIWATPEVWEQLRQYLGVTENLAVCDRLGIDGIIDIAPRYIGPELVRQDNYWENEWGMGFRVQSVEGGSYDEHVYYPLAQAETIADLEAYPWPSPDWYDYTVLPELAAQTPGRAINCSYATFFYWHMVLRGMELALVDPLIRPEFTHHLIQRVSDFFNEHNRRCFEAGQGLIDLTHVADDFGQQTGLMISPRMFDQFYRQPMQRAIDLAHTYGISVFHHDDGDIWSLLPRLGEMNIQVLNPVQWRCGDWDLNTLKASYGQKVCFHGGVDNQQTLPFGSPEDVRAEVRHLKETLGGDGTGYIIAPCHAIQPITPLENILALYEAALE